MNDIFRSTEINPSDESPHSLQRKISAEDRNQNPPVLLFPDHQEPGATRLQECSGEEKHPGSPSDFLLSLCCCQQESCSGGGADQHPGQVPGAAGHSQQGGGGGGGGDQGSSV